MENIALSDSNDDLTNEIIQDNNNQSRPIPRMIAEQQHVASELQDAANTDVTKGITMIYFLCHIHFLFYFKLRFSVLLILHLNLYFQHRII
jgi:hypothetical protein